MTKEEIKRQIKAQDSKKVINVPEILGSLAIGIICSPVAGLVTLGIMAAENIPVVTNNLKRLDELDPDGSIRSELIIEQKQTELNNKKLSDDIKAYEQSMKLKLSTMTIEEKNDLIEKTEEFFYFNLRSKNKWSDLSEDQRKAQILKSKQELVGYQGLIWWTYKNRFPVVDHAQRHTELLERLIFINKSVTFQSVDE